MAPATLTNHHDENQSTYNGLKKAPKSLTNDGQTNGSNDKLFIDDGVGNNEPQQVEEKLVRPDFVRTYNINNYNLKLTIEPDEEYDDEGQAIKCCVVHTLERDMPSAGYAHLVEELRQRILEHSRENAGYYSQHDLQRVKQDSWFVARFLLRFKLNVDEAFEMMSRALRFNHESLIHNLRAQDFPAELYQVGGLFCYEPDRKGNQLIYVRAKNHRRVPEVQQVLQTFIYKTIKQCDELANGRGIGLVIDCTGAGLAAADIETVSFLVSTLRNYFPKGLSYILVHELPWILRPIWIIAKNLISEEQSQLIKFSNANTIREYIKRDNLPDFMGGTCKRDYKAVPANCITLYEASKLWGLELSTIRKLLLRYKEFLPEGSIERFDELCDEFNSGKQNNSLEHYNAVFKGWTRRGSFTESEAGQDPDQENKPAD